MEEEWPKEESFAFLASATLPQLPELQPAPAVTLLQLLFQEEKGKTDPRGQSVLAPLSNHANIHSLFALLTVFCAAQEHNSTDHCKWGLLHLYVYLMYCIIQIGLMYVLKAKDSHVSHVCIDINYYALSREQNFPHVLKAALAWGIHETSKDLFRNNVHIALANKNL